jgi:hypothetical protein
MATRKKKTQPLGCLEIAIGLAVVCVIASGAAVAKALSAIVVVALIALIPVAIVMVMRSGRRSRNAARTRVADRRHEPAIGLLSALAYTDERLSQKEKDVLTSYVRSYEDADPSAAFVKPAVMPGIGSIDGFLDKCLMTMNPSETDVLLEHVRRLRNTRKTHPVSARTLFDDVERKLSRESGPVINDITEA